MIAREQANAVTHGIGLLRKSLRIPILTLAALVALVALGALAALGVQATVPDVRVDRVVGFAVSA